MKTLTKFIAVLFFLFSLAVSAQKTTWLDVDLKETDQSNFVYYKVTSVNSEEVNYFYKSGKIFRKLNYLKKKPVGNFSEFYETGELRVSGKYENGLEEGVWKTFYRNGKIKEKGKYKEGEKIGIWKSFYKNF